MLPPVDQSGLLPRGIHEANWSQLCECFGFTPNRLRLLSGLWKASVNLKVAGCNAVYVVGSLITTKLVPVTFDACWDPTGVDLAKVDPVFKCFKDERLAQKLKFGGEFFPSTAPANASGATFIEFFQTDRDGTRKGLVMIDLRSLAT